MPYGTKQPEEVMACVRRVVDILLARDVKAIVIACNTATSVTAASLRQELTIPVIGMEPALKPAALLQGQGKILVLATPNTLRLPKYLSLMEKWGRDAIPVPCPGLMELVEAGDDRGAEDYLHRTLGAYNLDGIKAVVLGCTHYVFLRDILSRLLPDRIAVMDGNEGTAQRLRSVLEEQGLLKTGAEGTIELMTSADDEQVLITMRRLLQRARH